MVTLSTLFTVSTWALVNGTLDAVVPTIGIIAVALIGKKGSKKDSNVDVESQANENTTE